MGENIGAVARAMANFGLSELRLVAPRDGWPNQRAIDVSAGASHIIEATKIYPDLAAATADMQMLYATTARPRDMNKRVVTPAEAAREMIGLFDDRMINHEPIQSSDYPNMLSSGGKAALVFGPERTGLENAEIAACDIIITIPTDPEFFSLNIAQSVVVVGYEWWKQSSESRIQSSEKKLAELRIPNSELLATKADWQGLFAQLEEYLDEVNYYRVQHKKTMMWQNLQTMLMRGRWSEQEVRSFRGMLRSLWERDKKNR